MMQFGSPRSLAIVRRQSANYPRPQRKRRSLISLWMHGEESEAGMFKLRIYILSGWNKGNLDHEEYFDTFAEARERYEELFVHDNWSLNPTMWEAEDENRETWVRVRGF